ncbi:MAG: hypothetical protein IJ488_03425 [Clostridia bacterium]|nr:hypothetical protein [Clostridia bacterium]
MPLDSTDIFVIGIGIIGAFVIIFLVFALKAKPSKKEMMAEEDERLNAEGEIFETHAEVVDMACDTVSVGYQSYKQPRAEKHFFVKFRDDDGQIYDIQVSEEYYFAFEAGQRGTLTLLDGQIDSFVLDEENP